MLRDAGWEVAIYDVAVEESPAETLQQGGVRGIGARAVATVVIEREQCVDVVRLMHYSR